MPAKMQNRSAKPKRQRKRKARTDVSSDSSSSSSSSESDSDSESDVAKVETKQAKPSKRPKVTKSTKSPNQAATPKVIEGSSSGEDTSEDANDQAASRKNELATAEEAFTSFYLRQITTEFAEDLDKIRAASDFNNKSIPMLVEALKQGRACFSKEERVSVGRAMCKT